MGRDISYVDIGISK